MSDRWALRDIANKLEEIIAKELDTYEKELEGNTDNAMEKVSNEFIQDLIPNIPLGHTPNKYTSQYGHLRELVQKSVRLRSGNKVRIIHFGPKYRIVHLLEYGWTQRDGKFMRREPFIRPTFNSNEEKYVRIIANSLRGG